MTIRTITGLSSDQIDELKRRQARILRGQYEKPRTSNSNPQAPPAKQIEQVRRALLDKFKW